VEERRRRDAAGTARAREKETVEERKERRRRGAAGTARAREEETVEEWRNAAYKIKGGGDSGGEGGEAFGFTGDAGRGAGWKEQGVPGCGMQGRKDDTPIETAVL
jgi:hypothetical protein